VLAGITINTLFWFVPVLVLAVPKLLLPIPVVRAGLTRILVVIGESWISVNTAIFYAACSIDWQLTGAEQLRRNKWYLLISNHQNSIDILLLQALLNRRIPFLKFFIKSQLMWFPFLGLAWWALDMPFMKRYSAAYLLRNPHMKGQDFATTRKACEKFRDTPTSVINFVEGTRFTEDKRIRHKDPYRYVLRPRAGGFAVAMTSMGDMFDAVLDVTIVYPHGVATFWDLCCGRHVEAVVNIRELPVEEWLTVGDYENDREWRRRVQIWLGEIWQEKDDLIQQIIDSRGSA
jgi:1-acyl-sn-glycerol-3-phosphate acyltransferase